MTTAWRRSGAAYLVVAVAVSGCGGRSLTSTDAQSGGAAGAGATSSGGSAPGGVASTSGSAGADTNPGFGGIPVKQPSQARGYLTAWQSSTGPSTFADTLLGSFAARPGRFDGCSQLQLGACSAYYDCPSAGSGTSAEPAPEDAGDLSVTGASGTISIPRNGGSYAGASQAELWPPAGGSITFAATGSLDVPAFTITVVAPPTVLLTAFNGTSAPGSLVRSTGAKLEWTFVGAGNAIFELDSDSDVRPQALVCQFLASAGAGEVSAAALDTLTSGFYVWHLEGTNTAEMDVGAWHLEADAAGFGSITTGQAIEIQ